MIVQKCGNDLVTWCCSHFVGVILESWLCVPWITWFTSATFMNVDGNLTKMHGKF